MVSATLQNVKQSPPECVGSQIIQMLLPGDGIGVHQAVAGIDCFEARGLFEDSGEFTRKMPAIFRFETNRWEVRISLG